MRPNPPQSHDFVRGSIRAFKAAHLVLDTDGWPSFSGAGVGGRYGPTDVAICVSKPEHVPPHPGCTCGWYAWKRRADAIEMLGECCAAVLEVELWGSFHEYERGYVAAAQQVRRVALQPYCIRCLLGRDSKTRPAAALVQPTPTRAELAPACDEHSEQADRVVALFELNEKLGVDVRWAPDDDELTTTVKNLALRLRQQVRRRARLLDSLLPDEVAHVFQTAIARDDDGALYVDARARLIQPLPGTDVPIRLTDEGEHEILVEGLVDFQGWQPRHNLEKFALAVRVRGTAINSPRGEDAATARLETTTR